VISPELQALVRYRLRQADESLQSAQLLHEGGRLRDAVNRAYYAMFYATLALLISQGKRASKHTGIVSLFDTTFVKTGTLEKRYSEWLHRAFDLRQDSDYREMFEVSAVEAKEVLQQAEVFVSEARKHLSTFLFS